MATTVTIAPFSMSSHIARRNSESDESPSSFTPVNGREQPPTGNGTRTPPTDHSPTEDSNTRPSSVGESPHTSPASQGNEFKPTISVNTAASPPESSDQTHKRKRSLSAEANGYPPAAARYDYSPPKREEHPQHMADRALHVLGDADREQYPTQQNGVHHPGHSNHSSWQSATGGQYTPSGNGGRMEPSELHLAEALQNHDAQTSEQRAAISRQSEASSNDAYGPDQTGSGQSNAKRKRIFSNRTKTGCMTCRRRKKKCDEGQPSCNNCMRGGFTCEGYNNRNSWAKGPGTFGKGPIPLVSKDGYSDVADPNYPVTNSPSSKRSSMHHDQIQPRAIAIEDGDGHGQYTASPQSAEPRSRNSYSGQQQQSWPHSGHPNYGQDRLPSFSVLARGDTVKSLDQYDHPQQQPQQLSRAPPSMSQQQQPPPPQGPNPTQNPSQWPGPSPQGPPPPQAQEFRPAYAPPHIDTRGPPPQSHHRIPSGYDSSKQPGAMTFSAEEVEKSKMLNGRTFRYWDATLENERDRCDAALERYNEALKIKNRTSIAQRQIFLEEVIDPSKDKGHVFVAPCKEHGYLGQGVRIERGFKCTYGYNLKIYEKVHIQHNCLIDDAAEVSIGPRTIIGDNVQIRTSYHLTGVVDRKGTETAWEAKPIRIMSEVSIGAGAMIYAGVTLGRNCTVEAGAIVRESLEEGKTLRAYPTASYTSR